MNIAERVRNATSPGKVKWTGRTIAELVRLSKVPWNSGSLARGDTSCAVGLLARALGASPEVIESTPTETLESIFTYNDMAHSRERAASNITEEFEDREFDVLGYWKRLEARARKCGEELHPDCELLEAAVEAASKPKPTKSTGR